jgi:tetratricopeptide (TPR) repeat protein
MTMLPIERFRFFVAIARLCRLLGLLTDGRIPARVFIPSFNPLMSALSLAFTILPYVSVTAAADAGPAPDPAIGSPSRRNVQAIALPATSADHQTSWIIEPDVPRIPHIAGLNSQLPPHVERRLSYAFDLAQRGATFSANGEFRAVLNMCALELDARERTTSRREALHQAWRALDEADEFNAGRFEHCDAGEVHRLADDHETQALKDPTDLPHDSIQAVQTYYAFAERRFIDSCRGLPGASLAFYGLARTFVAPGTEIAQAAGKAALLQRVALAIAPENMLAGNELGVLLAEHGHLDEAERLFRRCLSLNPTSETWRNLAVVYARQGDFAASRAALASADELAAREPASARLANRPQIDRSKDDVSSAEITKEQGFWDRIKLSTLRKPFWR